MRCFFVAGLFCLICVPRVALTGAEGSVQLPPYVLRWPSSIEHLLVADAETSTLAVFSRAGSESTALEVHVSVGQRGVGKQREGDRRTPLGVYFITEQLDTSDLDSMYGITAFPLDYPNTRDRHSGRAGSGIWLHGVKPGSARRPARDTDGCLAISNQDLAALAPRLEPQSTPVIITRSRSSRPDDNEASDLANVLESAVRRWGNLRQTGNTLDLASLYVDEYQRRGLNKEQWIQLWAAEARPLDLSIDALFIAADPEEKDIFVSRFLLKSDGVAHSKRLYWQRQEDGQMLIVAEDEW